MATKRERARMWKGWQDLPYGPRVKGAINIFIETGRETEDYQWLVDHPDPEFESPERMPNRPRP